MADPDGLTIAQVCEFTGLDPVVDRELVLAALKDKSGNVEAVVAAFYDDEIKFRQMFTWDETHFLGDRDNTGDSHTLSFDVQGPDSHRIIHGVAPHELHAGAPSRPPSRTQSPMGRMVDWTAQTNAAGIQEQEDDELQRALAASVSTLHTPQETGITGTTGITSTSNNEPDPSTSLSFFGPANRESYDVNQWAMVRATPESLEPGPSTRKRAPGAPAFLRCRRDAGGTYNLNAVLTVLHAIPAVRNALLQSGEPARNYGQNADWWRGSFIASAGEASEESGALEPESTLTFSEEIHRIMAFLDDTDRAYGTADNLANAKLLGESWDDNLDRLFFKQFKEINVAAVNHKIFTDIALLNVANMEEYTETDSYAILEAKVESGQCFGKLQNIYNLLDAIYWADLGVSFEPVATAKMAVSTRLGMVQIINISVDRLQAPIEIPEFFYPDRYQADHRQLALQLQLQLRSVCQALKESGDMAYKISTFMDKSSNYTLSQATLSEQAIGLGVQKLWQLKAAAFWRRHEASVGTPDEIDFSLADVDATELTEPEDLRVAGAIQAEMAVHRKKLADIGRKLQKLHREREACESLLSKLRLRNTGPGTGDDWAPIHRYRLRGVIVSSNEFYMCRREPDAEIELAQVDQWWHISFDASSTEPMCVEKTTIQTAQSAAFGNAVKPIVIYANDAALDEALEPLADPLRTFVRFDNRFFRQELNEEEVPRERKRFRETPASPSKRQQRSNSIDSMATNKASVGEMSDRDMSEMPPITERFLAGESFDEPAPAYSEYTTAPQEERAASPGTEMVELAIRRPGESPTVDMMGLDEHEDGHEDTNDDEHGEAQGEQEASPKDDSTALQGAHDAIQLLADWENPEGRYVGPGSIL